MKKILIYTLSISLISSCGGDKKSTEFTDNIKADTTKTEGGEELFEKPVPSSPMFETATELKSDEDTLSYCMGYSTASRLEMMTPTPNHEAFKQGMNDYISGAPKFDSKLAMMLAQGYFNQKVAGVDKSKPSGSSELLNKKDSCCYAYGIIAGDGISQQFKWANLDIFLSAYDENLDSSANVNDEGVRDVQMRVGQRKNKEESAIKAKAGTDFLNKNKKRSGVVTLPSGLQYEVLKAGNGPKPKANETVTVHYHGTTIDGKVFDSSVQRGQPASFGVTQVIKGWVEALQLMPVGSKWKLYIPYDLAYGDRGSPPKIPPYSALIFEVELLSIKN